MIQRRVVLSREATDDIEYLTVWIAEAGSPESALRYVAALRSYLAGFDLASERGVSRHDIRAGLRVIGFDRRLTICFRVTDTEVRILRIFRAGRDWTSAF